MKNKEALLGIDELLDSSNRIRKEEAGEFGENKFVYIKVLSGSERDKYDQFNSDLLVDDKGEIRKTDSAQNLHIKSQQKKYLIMLTLCNDKGVCLFDETNIDRINEMPGGFLSRIYLKSQEINGIGIFQSKELLKNLLGDLKEGHGSDSPDKSVAQ